MQATTIVSAITASLLTVTVTTAAAEAGCGGYGRAYYSYYSSAPSNYRKSAHHRQRAQRRAPRKVTVAKAQSPSPKTSAVSQTDTVVATSDATDKIAPTPVVATILKTDAREPSSQRIEIAETHKTTAICRKFSATTGGLIEVACE